MGHAQRDHHAQVALHHLKVLVVAPNRLQQGWVGELLQEQATEGSFGFEYCSSAVEALSLAEERSFDLCFFDDRLGKAATLQFLRTLNGWGRPFPVVVFADGGCEETIAEALQSGAVDYLIRGRTTSDLVLRTARYALERHQVEKEREGSRRRLRQLFDRSVVGVYRVSAEGQVLDGNDALARILGYRTSKDLVGQRLEEYSPAPTTAGESSSSLFAHRARQPFLSRELRLKREDGTPVWVRMTDSRDLGEDGETVSFEGTLVDISQAKLSEELLQRMESRYLALFDAVAGGVMVLDGEGSVAASNHRAGELLGLRMSELVGRPFGRCFAQALTEQRAPLTVQELPGSRSLITANTVEDTVVGLVRLDGSEVWVSMRATPVRGPGEAGPSSVILSLTDLSDVKRLEEQLIQAQNMEVVGRLAGGLSHDFRNLLTAISGYADLLERDSTLSEGALYGVKEIHRASQRAAKLVANMLSFGAKEEGTVAGHVVVDHVLVELQSMMRRVAGSKVELHLDLGSRGGVVLADPKRLEQVIMNLVINARDALPEGGELVLSTRVRELNRDQPKESRLNPGAYVELSVGDNGCGMDELTRRRAFEPFYTTKSPGKGTGLGLPTVREIVRKAGGEAYLTSQPGQGTRVDVLLPVSPWLRAARQTSESAHAS